MRARITIFRRRFMKQFDEIHKQAFPEKAKSPVLGYPDTGNGWYSRKLPYHEWFKFNNAMRCQINFLEHLTFAILCPILISFTKPTAALLVAIGIFVGRVIFTLSYSSGGPAARLPGALIMDFALFVGFGFMIAATLALAN